jgi:hypothetical protein
MKSKKDIQNHLDQLMKEAGKSPELKTSSGFEENLFIQIDNAEFGKRKSATIFTLSEVRKYAAIVLILILNISVVLFYTKSSDDDQSIDDIVQYSDEYFPDYTTLTSLE